MPIDYTEFSEPEIRIIRRLNTPPKVQEFVSGIAYNVSDRVSITDVLRKRRGDCLEAAVFASVVLTYHAIPNFIMDLSSVRDEDHVLCIFRREKCFGSIAQSKFLGLRYRNPVYATVRELAMSYFENYYNFYGEFTLRGYSKPVLLRNLTPKQLSTSAFMHELEARLCAIDHVPLVSEDIRLPRVSPTKFRQEVMIIPKGTRVGKQYRRK